VNNVIIIIMMIIIVSIIVVLYVSVFRFLNWRGCCEHGDSTSGFMKRKGKFLEDGCLLGLCDPDDGCSKHI
jgi:hypothetical protein